MIKQLLYYFAFIIIIIFFVGYKKINDSSKLKTTYINPSYMINMNIPEELVAISTNVFVGYVEGLIDTYYMSSIPYTRYKIRVVKNIKGEIALDSTINLNKEGGISEDGSRYILIKNDYLPSGGNYYIFCTRENLTDKSYTASGINTNILIDKINLENEYEKINKSSVYNRYVKAVENQVEIDIDIK